MNLALTGATGTVGRFVSNYLQAQGHHVRALVRDPSHINGFTRPPQLIQGDMRDNSALAELLTGVDGVVHCAFHHVPGRYRGGEGDDPETFWRNNFGATVRLLQQARATGVSRVVLMSSRAVFAHRGPDEDVHSAVSDDYPLRPDTQYGALKAAEEAVAAAAVDLQVCALRPTGVYGVGFPVNTSKWYALVCDVMQGKPIEESRTATEVHGRDVASAVELLLQAPPAQITGLGFNCSDITLSTRDLVALIAKRAGVPELLPPSSPAVVNPMRCDRLATLGWQPGGRPLLEQTVDELIAAVRASG